MRGGNWPIMYLFGSLLCWLVKVLAYMQLCCLLFFIAQEFSFQSNNACFNVMKNFITEIQYIQLVFSRI